MHPCLLQFRLLAHVLELKLKLPLPFIVQERGPSASTNPIFPCCVDPYRGEDRTDHDAKYELSHCSLCQSSFQFQKLAFVSPARRIVIDSAADTIGIPS